MKVKKGELVLENSSPNVGTEHEEINSVGQTKWENNLLPSAGRAQKIKKIKKTPVCRLAKWSLYFIRKKKQQNFVFFVSFFCHFFSIYFYSFVVFPTIPQLVMFCFMILV